MNLIKNDYTYGTSFDDCFTVPLLLGNNMRMQNKESGNAFYKHETNKVRLIKDKKI